MVERHVFERLRRPQIGAAARADKVIVGPFAVEPGGPHPPLPVEASQRQASAASALKIARDRTMVGAEEAARDARR